MTKKALRRTIQVLLIPGTVGQTDKKNLPGGE